MPQIMNFFQVHLADTVELLTATATHLCQKKQLLLIPIVVYFGLAQAFYSADFNAVRMSLSNFNKKA